MALFIPGVKCPLCGLPIKQSEDIVLFPPFVANSGDSLWRFSDGVFHAQCLKRDPLGTAAKAIADEVVAASAPDKRVCTVCGRLITDPDDYLFIGHLTSNPSDPLYEFNYLHFHRSHISNWKNLAHFLTLIKHCRESGAWKGTGLEWLEKMLSAISG